MARVFVADAFHTAVLDISRLAPKSEVELIHSCLAETACYTVGGYEHCVFKQKAECSDGFGAHFLLHYRYMRFKLFVAGFLSFVAVMLLAAYGRASPKHSAPTLLTSNGISIAVVLASTESERLRGLGGRRGLEERDGMLFVFPQSGYHGMWMKDMQFALDMVWLRRARTNATCAPHNAGKGMCLEVVDVRESVSPKTFPRVFYPREPAQYVLEVNTGAARGAGIQTGEAILFAQ